MLGLAGVTRAATGQRYVLQGALDDADLHTLARRLLANPVIQRYALGEIEPSFPQAAEASEQVEIIALRELDDAELLALSRDRRAALDLAEMQAIQAHFRAEGRDPTDVEFETLAQTWSEHCVHKTFKARIEITSYQLPIDGLLNTFIRSATNEINAPWVISAFEDNAGIIAFDDEYEVSFKVETHNHPSAIEPFGGANTGVGGVIRDVLGVSAKPIAATDILCFGPPDLDPRDWPEGVLPPRRLRAGVVAGVQDYGNKIGLPTVNGAIVYDPGFTANPLVFCGCVGLAPRGRHPRGARPGDRVIVLGGRTGRDGLRGATFSSLTMDAQTGEVAGASVQIGDPITEKGLIDVIVRARDAGLYHAITDCGAGGLSSAVGEMATDSGVAVDLAQVTLKYAGLAPWEIWLSEAQERMVLAVPAEALPALRELCATFGVEVTDLGAFSANGRLRVNYGARAVLDLPNAFLHGGRPQRVLTARLDPAPSVSPIAAPTDLDCNSVLLQLLAHPNIASKAAVIRLYDHEVQGGTVVKPLTGANDDGPSDACVLKPIGTRGLRGLVLSNGINAEFGKIDAYRMAPERGGRGHPQRGGGGRRPGAHRAAGQLLLGRPTASRDAGHAGRGGPRLSRRGAALWRALHLRQGFAQQRISRPRWPPPRHPPHPAHLRHRPDRRHYPGRDHGPEGAGQQRLSAGRDPRRNWRQPLGIGHRHRRWPGARAGGQRAGAISRAARRHAGRRGARLPRPERRRAGRGRRRDVHWRPAGAQARLTADRPTDRAV